MAQENTYLSGTEHSATPETHPLVEKAMQEAIDHSKKMRKEAVTQAHMAGQMHVGCKEPSFGDAMSYFNRKEGTLRADNN